MLKFYLFFCLLICNLIFIEMFSLSLVCLVIIVQLVNLVYYVVLHLDANYFSGIRKKFHVRLFTKNIFSCWFFKYRLIH